MAARTRRPRRRRRLPRSPRRSPTRHAGGRSRPAPWRDRRGAAPAPPRRLLRARARPAPRGRAGDRGRASAPGPPRWRTDPSRTSSAPAPPASCDRAGCRTWSGRAPCRPRRSRAARRATAASPRTSDRRRSSPRAGSQPRPPTAAGTAPALRLLRDRLAGLRPRRDRRHDHPQPHRDEKIGAHLDLPTNRQGRSVPAR